MSADPSLADGRLIDSFSVFMKETEAGLKHALVAAFGSERGLEAAAEAWAHGWEHWERVRVMENPAGYLWGVGRNKARSAKSHSRLLFPSVPVERERWVEPGLPRGLEQLSEKQRVSVLLKHGYGWTYAEISELLGISIASSQKHVERGLAKLRKALGTEL